MPRTFRQPYHAGSWYENSERRLSEQIEEWLGQVQHEADENYAQAVIAPHAGYSYCGHIMAYAYSRIDTTRVERVFIMGPSHHFYTEKCVLSTVDAFRTPLGDRDIDTEVYQKLLNSGLFQTMEKAEDEAEHSLEMHTPYIEHILRGKDFTLIPIMVGSLSRDMEGQVGKLLSPYVDDPTNLFVLSSDFCHWGRRFQYQPYDPAKGPIWKYIEWLDNEGIATIKTGDPNVFRNYLSKTGNTVCGRYPIGLFLNMLQHCQSKFDISFVAYDQSSKCFVVSDSSVSYAAAIFLKK